MLLVLYAAYDQRIMFHLYLFLFAFADLLEGTHVSITKQNLRQPKYITAEEMLGIDEQPNDRSMIHRQTAIHEARPDLITPEDSSATLVVRLRWDKECFEHLKEKLLLELKLPYATVTLEQEDGGLQPDIDFRYSTLNIDANMKQRFKKDCDTVIDEQIEKASERVLVAWDDECLKVYGKALARSLYVAARDSKGPIRPVLISEIELNGAREYDDARRELTEPMREFGVLCSQHHMIKT